MKPDLGRIRTNRAMASVLVAGAVAAAAAAILHRTPLAWGLLGGASTMAACLLMAAWMVELTFRGRRLLAQLAGTGLMFLAGAIMFATVYILRASPLSLFLGLLLGTSGILFAFVWPPDEKLMGGRR